MSDLKGCDSSISQSSFLEIFWSLDSTFLKKRNFWGVSFILTNPILLFMLLQAYGFAAVSVAAGTDICGSCWELSFTGQGNNNYFVYKLRANNKKQYYLSTNYFL